MITHLRQALFPALALLALAAAAAPHAQAAIIFDVDSITNGDSPNKVDSTKPFVSITIEDAGTDLVSIKIDATNLAAENFIPFLMLNYTGNAALELSVDSFPPQASFATFSASQDIAGGNQVKAGLFNIQFSFNLPGNLDRFNGGETSTWILSGAGLDETDFLLTSIDKPSPNPSDGGFYTAIRVQGIQLDGGREGSGSIGGTSVRTVVPEPSSVALLGIGGIGMLGLTWKRRRRHAA